MTDVLTLVHWGDAPVPASWQGPARRLESASVAALDAALRACTSEWILLWGALAPVPSMETVRALQDAGVQAGHGGLACGLGELLPDLYYAIQDWSMLNAPATHASTSWRLSLDRCLVRRDVLEAVGGLDLAFASLAAAGLELGHRLLMNGAVIEHRPELGSPPVAPVREVPREDLYTFVLRRYGLRWARYILARRLLAAHAPWSEALALRRARARCARATRPALQQVAPPVAPRVTPAMDHTVSVIIPTLGRYPYLPEALESIRAQTIRPCEVVVVDQNPPESRQPAVYAGYDDLHLHVIWQDERGQSLARNTALARVKGTFVFMFDDDSIAAPDLVERHLHALLHGQHDVSTGVAYPPPPESYVLPLAFQHPRLAQTLDTGNAMLSTELARRMGGLDRNYDFGPGTDTDFGTRLYLAGYRILHNPLAARIHYKAPMGGLRVHGSVKYNTDRGLLDAFPPVTQAYYGLRYLSPRQRREREMLMYVTSKLPPELRDPRASATHRLGALLRLALLGVTLPLKRKRARARASALLGSGVRTAVFETP